MNTSSWSELAKMKNQVFEYCLWGKKSKLTKFFPYTTSSLGKEGNSSPKRSAGLRIALFYNGQK